MPKSAVIWCLCLTMVLLPWYVVRFSFLGIPFTLLECAVLLTIAVAVSQESVQIYRQGLFRYMTGVFKVVNQSRLLFIPVFLFVLATTISLGVGENFTAGLGIYKAYVLEPIALSIIAWTSIRHQRDWWLIIGAILLAALQVALLALSQHLFGWPNFAPEELIQGRSSAMYNTANAVGLFIGPIALLAGFLAVAWWRINVKVSVSLAVIAIASFIAIGFSQSTGALVAIAGSLLFGSVVIIVSKFVRLDYRLWVRVVLVGMLIYVASTMIFLTGFNHPPEVANPYTRPGFSTFTVRQCTWQGTISLLSEKPFIGSGLAGFAPAYLEFATCDAEPLVYPHNLVLNFWTETGFLGLSAIIGIIISWFILCGRLVVGGGMRKWISLGLCMVPTYWLIHGLVDVPYFKNDLAVLWWMLFGLTISANKLWVNSTISDS